MKNISINISVIIPIYNVEKELRRCVDSVLNQTLENIEILLVNDGSTDESPRICDEYAISDSRIIVLHKENGGLSDARNCGLKESKGEFILFVDSDDYIDKEACEKLYSIAIQKELDIVIGDAVRIENNSISYLKHSDISINKVMSGNEFLKEQLAENSMHMATWLNLYSRKLITNNKLYFKKRIYHEDEQWTPRVFLNASRVLYININFYNYIIREGSITKRKNLEKNGIDLIETCYYLEKLYRKVEDKQLRALLNDNLGKLFLHAIHHADLYDRKYSKVYNKFFLFGKPKTFKNKIKAFLFVINKYAYKYINNYVK